jgi:hypothetical protein
MKEVNDELLKKVSIVAKLLYVQTRPKIEELKRELLKTAQQKKAYEALDGERTIKEIAKFASYSGTRTLEEFLPEWERKGLILSQGKGPAKKYINLENLEV